VQRSGEHSTEWSFTTTSGINTKDANKGERSGKLAVGKPTAQLFGLYW
jgi:hypothetical protein